jgi:predicted lipoprotein with Yx(FWY)xxD motif
MRRTLVLLAAFALFIAACGGGGGASPAAATAKTASGTLGTILVDNAGRTLYGFTPDVGQAAPTCVDACAATWPPLIVTTATAGTGLDASKMTTITRTDGAKQAKYGDYPLYYFATDTAAGQTNGQGVAGKWFVIGADGQLIQ